jgi:adenine-specific DNA-methyltransferase
MVKKIGQYFTKHTALQDKVASLCQNKGAALEPSAGEGDLVAKLEDTHEVTAIELDNTLDKHCKTDIIYQDFFDFITTTKFNTIFGNPPYLKLRELPKDLILKMEQDSILSSCNIFYYFIEKCYHLLATHGEIIFIVPREFFNSTRAVPLRKLLFNNGTITDVIDYGEAKLFKDAAPSIVIFRYEKNNYSHITNYVYEDVQEKRYENLINGSYVFSKKPLSNEYLSHIFDIRVGLVTGLNSVFEKDTKLSIDIICSDYIKTKKKRRFIFVDGYSLEEIQKLDPELYEYLLKHKEVLISRRIKKFNETNWYYYGAVRNLQFMQQQGQCIYVNAKTRVDEPFFIADIDYFDGSVLALYPRYDLDLIYWVNKLNSSRDLFQEQGLYVNNRFLFTVKTLNDFCL